MLEHERPMSHGCCCFEEEAREFSPSHFGHGHHCECGEPSFHFRRRFPTREERIARLETYLKELKEEVRAAEELLSELKK